MKTECFTNYTSEDFIFDKDFRDLVLNPDEADKLKSIIEAYPQKRYEISLAIEVIRGLHVTRFSQTNQRKDELWQEIITKPKVHIQLTFVKYAAAILLLLGLGTTFYFFKSHSSDHQNLTAQNEMSKIANWDENNTQLVLANGKVVTIDDKESLVEYSNDGSRIKVNDSEDIVLDKAAEGINKMIVPYGKRSTLILSDGTKVSLNSGSILVFPAAFASNSREVQLTGEGYFDVTHNKMKPFYVKTDAFVMKVYGTKFDIQSYQQDNASNVILVEGKVSLKSNIDASQKEVFLTPNQRATVVDGSSKVHIDDIDNIEEYTSWTEGYLSFSDEDLTHLLKKVSRYYNIDIDASKIENVNNVFGKLDLKDDVERVLDGISFISNTKYRKVGSKYEFYQ